MERRRGVEREKREKAGDRDRDRQIQMYMLNDRKQVIVQQKNSKTGFDNIREGWKQGGVRWKDERILRVSGLIVCKNILEVCLMWNKVKHKPIEGEREQGQLRERYIQRDRERQRQRGREIETERDREGERERWEKVLKSRGRYLENERDGEGNGEKESREIENEKRKGRGKKRKIEEKATRAKTKSGSRQFVDKRYKFKKQLSHVIAYGQYSKTVKLQIVQLHLD